jgi:hypothetical protein
MLAPGAGLGTAGTCADARFAVEGVATASVAASARVCDATNRDANVRFAIVAAPARDSLEGQQRRPAPIKLPRGNAGGK